MQLILIMLARCNAACAHCSQSYGPRRDEALDKRDIIRLMNEAAAIDDGEPLEFDLTGGELFTDFTTLREVIEHGARLGGEVSCVTNAYWARTPEIAKQKLAILREAGLSWLSASTSRFHQQFVPLARVRYALEAARELGMGTEFKGAVTQTEMREAGGLDTWERELQADHVNVFPILPWLREGAELPTEEYYREPGLPPEKCPAASVCVDFNGMATSCCSPGNDEFLSIGNVHEQSLADIHANFNTRGKQRILRDAGPVAFALGARALGHGDRLREHYAGPCDLCLHVRHDPVLRAVAEDMSMAAEETQQTG